MEVTGENTYTTIAHIYNNYSTKFGIPRQSGLVEEVESVIIFDAPYRSCEAIRGLDTYNYLWLIWVFSDNSNNRYRTTVRPPRLGGNARMGVFATRSPYRPNPFGLSSVKITRIVEDSENGPLIYVSGADMLNGTPILDIKPYLPYVDMHEDAIGGFTQNIESSPLAVTGGLAYLDDIDPEDSVVIRKLLEQDPRPAYHNEPDRIYQFEHGRYHIAFRVQDNQVIITGIGIISS